MLTALDMAAIWVIIENLHQFSLRFLNVFVELVGDCKLSLGELYSNSSNLLSPTCLRTKYANAAC